MSGEHPIDELFRQGLHDAEAAPPAEAWAGIARALDTSGRRSRGGYWRWTWGLLVLVGGAAGFWALTDNAAPERPTPARTEQLPAGTTATRTLDPDAGASEAVQAPAPVDTRATATPATGVRNIGTDQALADHRIHTTSERSAITRSTHGERPATVTTEQPPSTPTGSAAPAMDALSGITAAVPGPVPPVQLTHGEASALTTNEEGSARKEDHMATVRGRSSALPRAEVNAPQGLLTVPMAVLPVLSGTRWWLAVQGEHQRGSLEWRGGEPGVAEALNTSETWLGRWVVSLAVGRSWRSGWTVGGGISLSEARSRFLRTTFTPGQVETVIDTTWVGTPMGQQTMYTWNIVESTVVEPGTTQVARATNRYREARLFMEVGKRVWAHGRWSAHGRLTTGAIWTLTQAGNTVRATADGGLTVLDLRDRTSRSGSVIRPFAAMAAELRFRVSPELALGALPSINITFAPAAGSTPNIRGVEAGAGLRLTYLFPYNRPLKHTLPTAPLE